MSLSTQQLLTSPTQYKHLIDWLTSLPANEQWQSTRRLCQTDLFYLLVYGCNRPDANRQWLFERCREVQAEPNKRLDLWAREHYKSTIITFALTIQDILNNPELTVGIFSHTRPIAKGFLRQIKWEFERNEFLIELFPDILYSDPRKQSPKWSEDEGIVVKRNGNPKEGTVEAWGLVDGQPTSKHYKLMVYDDVVTRESVTTPEMIAKTTEAWELSRNLTSEGGYDRHIGTRYHFGDSYTTIMKRGFEPRVHKATEDGQVNGTPVLLTAERIRDKRIQMGPYTFSCQMLQDPKADETQGFKTEWLKRFRPGSTGHNLCIVCDPASEKKKDSDYTAALVVGFGADRNIYVHDIVRDRLNLKQRAQMLFDLHRRWQPGAVGYERYGMMADIEHIRDKMETDNYRFDITEVGGPMPKNDRIKRLIPLFADGRIYMPENGIQKTDYEGRTHDLVSVLIEEEFKGFPVSLHDDLMDAFARIIDLYGAISNFPWPIEEETYGDDLGVGAMGGGGWLAA